TIFLAEGYANCNTSQATVMPNVNQNNNNRQNWYFYVNNTSQQTAYTYTFAGGTAKVTTTSNYYVPRFYPVAGKTFQVRPIPGQCDGSLPQSFSYAVQTMMGDGSVRMVASDVSTGTWSAALTPSAGDALGNDW